VPLPEPAKSSQARADRERALTELPAMTTSICVIVGVRFLPKIVRPPRAPRPVLIPNHSAAILAFSSFASFQRSDRSFPSGIA
jgi:hypothetical protein